MLLVDAERGAATKGGREAWQYCMEHGGQAADVGGKKVVGNIDMLATPRIDQSSLRYKETV